MRRANRPHPSILVRILRTVSAVFLIVAAIYFYQPLRYDFFPRPAPNPNPKVSPDVAVLFAPHTRVAIVAAHPDDPEYYIGGTLLKLHASGAEIAIVMCTDGDKGYYTRLFTDPAANRRVRRAEQLAAAAQYGAKVYFLARSDGRLKADDALVGAVATALNDFRPQCVLTFDPIYPPRVQHSDHLQSGVAGILASRVCDSVKWILRFSTHAPNYVDDVSKQWDQRQEILAIHKSQFSGEHLEGIRAMIEDRSSSEGAPYGFDYGEWFRCTKLR